MIVPRAATPHRRVPLALAVLALVFACLGMASLAGSAPAAHVAPASR